MKATLPVNGTEAANSGIRWNLDQLSAIVRKAGRAVVEISNAGFETNHKENRDPVTTADLAANRILRQHLTADSSEYGWLSEETQDDTGRLAKEQVWIVDPIDGTKEFISGIPEFALSIALVERGLPVLAAVYNPSTDELFTASRGNGVWRNGKPIKAKRYRKSERLVILASRTDFVRGKFQAFGSYAEIRPIGSIAYKLALVAAGMADATFSLEPKNEWDICAGVLLVEESGGKVTDNKGWPFIFNRNDPLVGGIVAASSRAYPRVEQLIAQAQQRKEPELPSPK